jgi:hypothetical protein
MLSGMAALLDAREVSSSHGCDGSGLAKHGHSAGVSNRQRIGYYILEQ